jgi:hypothetical protein
MTNRLGVGQVDKNSWVQTYKPKVNVDGTLIQFDVIDDLEFVSGIANEFVWSEIWDFDSERPWLVSGCVLDENGGLSWYICEKPWESSDLILIEWEED